MPIPLVVTRLSDIEPDPSGTQTLQGSLLAVGSTNPAGLELQNSNDGQIYLWFSNPLNTTPRRWAWYTQADRALTNFALWCNKLARNIMAFGDSGTTQLGCADPQPSASIAQIGWGQGNLISGGNVNGTMVGGRDSNGTGFDWMHLENQTSQIVFLLTNAGNLRLGGSLGVGNSAAASGPVGSVVKKIQVFDTAGNSLGFIPVYSSIT